MCFLCFLENFGASSISSPSRKSSIDSFSLTRKRFPLPFFTFASSRKPTSSSSLDSMTGEGRIAFFFGSAVRNSSTSKPSSSSVDSFSGTGKGRVAFFLILKLLVLLLFWWFFYLFFSVFFRVLTGLKEDRTVPWVRPVNENA